MPRGKFQDLSGMRFGRLRCLKSHQAPIDSIDKHARWECVCDCGEMTSVRSDALLSHKTKSCGCLGLEGGTITPRFGIDAPYYKHGLSRTKEYRRLDSERRRQTESYRIYHRDYIRYYRSMKRANTDKIFSFQELESHLQRLGKKCIYCGGSYEHLDHFTPLSREGKNNLDNLFPSCARCNVSKGNRIVFSEWIPVSSRYMPISLLERAVEVCHS